MPYTDITPPNGWIISSIAVIGAPTDPSMPTDATENGYHAEMRTAGEHAFLEAIQNKLRDNNSPFVEVADYQRLTLIGTRENILSVYYSYIKHLLNTASNQSKGLILGFPVWQFGQVFDTCQLIGLTKKLSDGHAICIVGGPGLHGRDTSFENHLFNSGADILNIGGAKEICDWLASLTTDNRFHRDSKGILHTTTPNKSPFFTQPSQQEEHNEGNFIPPVLATYGSQADIYAHIPKSGCRNSCIYCLQGRHSRKPVTGSVTRYAKIVGQLISDTHEIRGYGTILNLVNPNPFEKNATALREFFKNIPIQKIAKIMLFGEAMSLWDKEACTRHYEFLKNALSKNPHLRIELSMSMDAIQWENDGDFLGRYADKGKYGQITEKLPMLIKEVKKTAWGDRADMMLAFIMNPAMTADIYLKKLCFCPEEACAYQTLHPFAGSKLAKQYQGHFVPQHIMELGWDIREEASSCYLSPWGNQFLNGDLLDIFACTKYMSLYCDDKRYSEEFIFPLFQKLNGQPFDNNRLSDPTMGDALDKIVDAQQPRVIQLLITFIEDFLNKTGDLDRQENTRYIKRLRAVIDWVHDRETYLCEHQPIYAENENCQKIIMATKKMSDTLNQAIKKLPQDNQPPSRFRHQVQTTIFHDPHR